MNLCDLMQPQMQPQTKHKSVYLLYVAYLFSGNDRNTLRLLGIDSCNCFQY